jgi:hypothetical protein
MKRSLTVAALIRFSCLADIHLDEVFTLRTAAETAALLAASH